MRPTGHIVLVPMVERVGTDHVVAPGHSAKSIECAGDDGRDAGLGFGQDGGRQS